MSRTQFEYIQKLNKIEIDPDMIVKHYRYNKNMKGTLYTRRSIHIRPVQGIGKTKIGVDPRDEGGYYPDKPHPIWRSPSSFVENSMEIGFPNRSENRIMIAGTIDEEPGSDEFEKQCEIGMQNWKELWEETVRKNLKDEITFTFGEMLPEADTLEHTVKVEYVKDQ